MTPAPKRAAAFGLVGAAFGLGFILGPAIGGILGDRGLRIPYFVAAGLNFLNFLYGLFVLPESLPRESRRAFSFARANPFASLANLGRHRIVLGLTGTLTATYLAQMILQSVWALTGQARFGWTPRSVGLSLMVVGLSTAIVQGALVRMIISRVGERRALLFGIAMSVAGQIGFGLATKGWVMYAMILPFCLGGLAGPATQALITSEVGPTEQGEVQGSLNSLAGVMAVIGPLVGTVLFARFGTDAARPHVPGAPFLVSACVLVVGWVLAARLFARMPGARPLGLSRENAGSDDRGGLRGGPTALPDGDARERSGDGHEAAPSPARARRSVSESQSARTSAADIGRRREPRAPNAPPARRPAPPQHRPQGGSFARELGGRGAPVEDAREDLG